VDFVGGWDGFARDLGLTSRHHNQQARDVLRLGQHIEWAARHGHAGGGWWTWTYKRGSRAGPGRVRVVLGDMLLPGYAVEMKYTAASRARLTREARRLVPELRHEPPLSAVEGGLEGPGLLLQRLFMLALVDGSDELARKGTVQIPEDEWQRLATDAGLPRERLMRVLESWCNGDDKAPALLERNGWGFTLASEHSLELEFLVEQGQRRIDGLNDRSTKSRKKAELRARRRAKRQG
jgi:hypothetical protein